MKLVNACGGLGNQMFCYALCEGFREKGEKSFLFIGESADSGSFGHQGYELEKLFPSISIEESKYTLRSKYMFYGKKVSKKLPQKYRKKFLHLFLQIEDVKELHGFIFSDIVFSKSKFINQFYIGLWQSYKYFKDAEVQVKEKFSFNINLLSKKTIDLSKQIDNCNSVSIHIRRDDYMNEIYLKGLGSVCDEKYYKNAIQYILDNVKNPRFYIFTDDHKWVADNFNVDSATYVKFNSNEDSWQDMYLMSKCKHNIIANSTFSWWGAYLNNFKNKIIVAPKRWWSTLEKDDVIPVEWIRL